MKTYKKNNPQDTKQTTRKKYQITTKRPRISNEPSNQRKALFYVYNCEL